MDRSFRSWNDFWDREAKQLYDLPSPLVGAAPVSVYCLQPRPQERLVFLNKTGSAADPQFIPVGPTTRDLVYDDAAAAPWKSVLSEVRQGPIDEYLKIPDLTRRKIMDAEVDRYGPTYFNTEHYHPALGTQFRIQAVIPSPLYHDQKHWWARLPRLGIALTFDDLLGASEPLGPREEQTLTSDSLLLICAISAGNRILSKRLRMIFTNSFARVYGDDKVKNPEQDIAKQIATRGVHETDQDNWDKSLFLIANLILGHHLFFPHAPEALMIFRLLGKDPSSEVLVPHAWDAVEFGGRPGSLEDHIDRLVIDLKFLIRAMIRWAHPSDPEAISRISDADFKRVVLELTKVVLALLCGTPAIVEGQYAAIIPPDALLETCKVTLPAFEKGQISHLRQKRTPRTLEVYSDYLRCLSPIVPAKPRGGKKKSKKAEEDQDWFNSIKHHEIEFSGDQPRPLGKRKLEWMGKYVRARLELELKK